MNCKTFEKVAYLFIKHELPQDKMKEAKSHLSQCSDCNTKIHKINMLLDKTGEYLRSTEEKEQLSLPGFSSITKAQEKHHQFFRPTKFVAAAAALLFMVISLFIMTQNNKNIENIKKTTLKEERTVSLQKTQPAITKRDVNILTDDKPARKKRSVLRADKPVISDEFSKSYSRWLDARRNSAEPVVVEVIYPEQNIKTIHLLTNKKTGGTL